MRYFILIIALFITTISFSQGGKLIRIKVNKGETLLVDNGGISHKICYILTEQRKDSSF